MISGVFFLVLGVILYIFVRMTEEESYLMYNKEIYKARTVRIIRYSLIFITVLVILILLALKL